MLKIYILWGHEVLTRSFPILALFLWLSTMVKAEEANSFLPNKSISPGIAGPIDRTITCSPKIQLSSRPDIDENDKLRLLDAYHIGIQQRPSYAIDTVVPKALGGAIDDLRNLWPHLKVGPWNLEDKRALDAVLEKMICAGALQLAVAQHALMEDWTTAYEKYVGRHAANGNQTTKSQCRNEEG
jgi:hypothetical protein